MTRTLQRSAYVVKTLQRYDAAKCNVGANFGAMAKRDDERGPVAAWLRRERLARGWTTHDAVRELAKRGIHITEPSYRGYEAGPRVSAPVRKGMEAAFGVPAPATDTEKEATEPKLSDLIAALQAQTEAISALVTRLDQLPAEGTPLALLLTQVVEAVSEQLEAPPLPDDAGAHEESGEPPDAGHTSPLPRA
jgi:transcriptional regulator with XRE-family HTH domain